MTLINIGHDGLKGLVRDRAMLIKNLDSADTAPLLMVLVHLGGDPAWLERIGQHIKGPWSFHDETPADVKSELYEAVADVLAETIRRISNEDSVSSLFIE